MYLYNKEINCRADSDAHSLDMHSKCRARRRRFTERRTHNLECQDIHTLTDANLKEKNQCLVVFGIDVIRRTNSDV